MVIEAAQAAAEIHGHDLAGDGSRQDDSQPLNVAPGAESQYIGAQSRVGEEYRQEEHQHEPADLAMPGSDEGLEPMEQQPGGEAAEDGEDPELVGADRHREHQRDD